MYISRVGAAGRDLSQVERDEDEKVGSQPVSDRAIEAREWY